MPEWVPDTQGLKAKQDRGQRPRSKDSASLMRSGQRWVSAKRINHSLKDGGGDSPPPRIPEGYITGIQDAPQSLPGTRGKHLHQPGEGELTSPCRCQVKCPAIGLEMSPSQAVWYTETLSISIRPLGGLKPRGATKSYHATELM